MIIPVYYIDIKFGGVGLKNSRGQLANLCRGLYVERPLRLLSRAVRMPSSPDNVGEGIMPRFLGPRRRLDVDVHLLVTSQSERSSVVFVRLVQQ